MLNETEVIKSFGKVLKAYRESSGMSQEQMAHAIGSHSTHISRLENGHKQPTLTTVFKISKVLNVSPEELIAKVGDKMN
jgi:transcriptional regulator with XRE-family HTH domain